jgi:hypothetical protein
MTLRDPSLLSGLKARQASAHRNDMISLLVRKSYNSRDVSVERLSD